MSHFTCLVIGPDPEAQLAPFDENRVVEPYKDRIDLDEVGRAIAFFAEHPEHIHDPLTKELLEAAQQGKADGQIACLAAYNETPVAIDDEGFYRMSTYNPDSKWDWYSLGGRWSGYFPLRVPRAADAPPEGLGRPGAFDNIAPPNTVDSGRKGDLDLDRMRREAGEKAGASWDTYREVVDGLAPMKHWSAFVADVDAKRLSIEAARAAYHAQPRVAAFATEAMRQKFGWSVEHERFDVERRLFVVRAEAGAIPGYATLHEGRWMAPGRMGWFGMSTETESEELGYLEVVNGLIDALPDDALLSLYDLHI